MVQISHDGFLALGQARAVVVEQSQCRGKSAALISLDFGDGGEPLAVVLLAARKEGVRMAELFQSETGEASAPLARGLVAYERAVNAITSEAGSDAVALQSRFDGRTQIVVSK
jgi:hypothetical protein